MSKQRIFLFLKIASCKLLAKCDILKQKQKKPRHLGFFCFCAFQNFSYGGVAQGVFMRQLLYSVIKSNPFDLIQLGELVYNGSITQLRIFSPSYRRLLFGCWCYHRHGLVDFDLKFNKY